MNAKRARALIAISADSKSLERDLAEAHAKLKRFGRRSKKLADDTGGKKRGGLIRSMLHGGSAVLGAAGLESVTGFIGGQVSGILDFEHELTRMQIDAQLSTDQVAALRQQIMDTSEATGQSRQAILEGAHAYQILTGDAKGAVQVSRLFAEVANASGASMQDIAATAASMRKNLGFDPKDFRQGFDVLLKMGHEGSVELRDLAAEMSGLAPQFKDFGDKLPQEKLSELVATAEGMRNDFKDAAETADGFRQLMTQIRKKHQDLEDAGIKVFRTDGHGHILGMRDFMDITREILKSKQFGNDKGLTDLFGRQNAVRAIEAIRDHWADIVRLQHDSLASDQVAKDNATWMNSTSGKLALAFTHLKNAVAEAFTPERIDRWVNAVTKLVDTASKAVQIISFAFTGETGDQQTDANAEGERLVERANAPRHGRYVVPGRGMQTVWETQQDAEAAAIEEAKADLKSGDRSKAMGGRKFLESEGYAFDQQGNPLWEVHNIPGMHDPWASPKQAFGPQMPDDIALSRAMANGSLSKAVEEGVKRGLAAIGVTVKMDSSAVAKKVDNAHHQRAPRGR